jgi:nascent polypeptide-associated complex subunit alpha
MMPGMNPGQMRKMMQRMGIQQNEIDAEAVIIKTPGKDIIITEPSVVKVNMMGQETFQISGHISEQEPEAEPELSEDDIKTVMEQAKVAREEAVEALKRNDYDLAKAILALTSK